LLFQLRGLLAIGWWRLGHGWGLDRLRRDDNRLLLGRGHGLGRGWGLDRLRRDDNGLLLGRGLDGRARCRLRGWLHARGGLIGFVWCHRYSLPLGVILLDMWIGLLD
jgi:hypothetical protein